MYWWSIEKLAQNLQKNTYVRSDSILFWLLNILLTLCQLVVYASMIFSFLIIEYHFKDMISNQHVNTPLYTKVSCWLALFNVLVMVAGIAYCYYQHRKNNGVRFWQKFSALNSSIGFHVLLYSIALLFIAISALYVVVHIKIETFKGTIINTESIAEFLKRLLNSPFGKKTLTPSQPQASGFFSCTFGLPCSIFSIPFIPGKIAAFLQELRSYIMSFYPVLAALPTVLLIIQYSLVQRWFKPNSKLAPK